MATPDATLVLGLDRSQVQSGLIKTARDVEAAGAQMGKGFKGASEHGEHLLASTHKVASQLTNVAKSLVSGGGAADVFAAGLEAVEKSLHLSLGELAGLGIGAVLVEQIGEAISKARELNEEFENLTAYGGGPSEFQTDTGLDDRIRKYQDLIDQIKKQGTTQDEGSVVNDIGLILSHPLNYLAAKVKHPFTGYESTLQENSSKVDELRADQGRSMQGIASKRGQENDITATRENIGEHAARLAEIQKKVREEIGTNNEKYAGQGAEADLAAMNAKVREGADIQTAAENKRFAAAQRVVDLETRLVAIKASGADVEVQSAAARLDAAQRDLDASTDEDKPAAQNKVEAARTELEETQRTVREKRAQLTVETDIANLRGPDLANRREALRIEQEALAAKLAGAKEDEKPEIRRDIARNAQQLVDQDRAEVSAGDAHTRSLIETNTEGPTISDRKQRIEDTIGEVHREQDENAQRVGGPDPEQADRLNKELASLRAQKAELEFSQDRQLAGEKAVTAELEAQTHGHGLLATQLRIQADYAEKIAQAQHRGDTAAVAELQKQEAAALQESAIATSVQLATESAVTDELQLQAEGRTTLADLARTQAQYEEKIAEARRQGNEALAATLTKQRDLSTLIERAETYLKGPAARREEEKHARALRHAERTITARDADAADRKRRGSRSDASIRDGIKGGANPPAQKVDTINVTTLTVGTFTIKQQR